AQIGKIHLVAAPMHIIADQPRHRCNPTVPGPPGFIAVAVVTSATHDGFRLRRIPLNIRHNRGITREGKIRVDAAGGDNLQQDKACNEDTEDNDCCSSLVHSLPPAKSLFSSGMQRRERGNWLILCPGYEYARSAG